MRNNTRSASSSAFSTCATINAAMPSPSVPGTRPPVSTSVYIRSPNCATPYWRSRVKPGMLATNAARVAVRRLKSVDLPTLGRPTNTICGAADIAPHCLRATLADLIYAQRRINQKYVGYLLLWIFTANNSPPFDWPYSTSSATMKSERRPSPSILVRATTRPSLCASTCI